jgi:hypothetical protein
MRSPQFSNERSKITYGSNVQCPNISKVVVNLMLHAEFIDCNANEQLRPSSYAFLVGMANDLREALSRLMRVESHIATLNLNAVTATNITQDLSVKVGIVQQQLQQLQVSVSSNSDVSKSSEDSQNDSRLAVCSSVTVLPTDSCGFPNCKIRLSNYNRPCSAAVSLRHMLECEACPATECRISMILNQMAKFAKAPQVCHIDTCCYCGQGLTALSPDARSQHRKSCLVDARLKCSSTDTHDATVDLLNRIWSSPVDVVSPNKRFRSGDSTGRAHLSPILAFVTSATDPVSPPIAPSCQEREHLHVNNGVFEADDDLEDDGLMVLADEWLE